MVYSAPTEFNPNTCFMSVIAGSIFARERQRIIFSAAINVMPFEAKHYIPPLHSLSSQSHSERLQMGQVTVRMKASQRWGAVALQYSFDGWQTSLRLIQYSTVLSVSVNIAAFSISAQAFRSEWYCCGDQSHCGPVFG